MPKFKNIRLKKRGGGTRLQRVQVLKSGKFKFDSAGDTIIPSQEYVASDEKINNIEITSFILASSSEVVM